MRGWFSLRPLQVTWPNKIDAVAEIPWSSSAKFWKGKDLGVTYKSEEWSPAGSGPSTPQPP